jgi:hypothetical protein
MPDRGRAEARCNTGIAQVPSGGRYLPGGRDERPGSVSRRAVPHDAGPLPHMPVIACTPVRLIALRPARPGLPEAP